MITLPSDCLGAILTFGDLRMRFTAVVSCSGLRDAQSTISPAHEYRLLVRRLPLLKGLTLSSSPREVYAQVILFEERPPGRVRPELPPPRPADAYTFRLHLELVHEGPMRPSTWEKFPTESLCVATGTLGTDSAVLTFHIEEGTWERMEEKVNESSTPQLGTYWDVRASIMATRLSNGHLECTRLCRAVYEELDEDDICMKFELDEFPVHRDQSAFILALQKVNDFYFEPDLSVVWEGPRQAGASVLQAKFRHYFGLGMEDMSREEALMTLDYFVPWGRL